MSLTLAVAIFELLAGGSSFGCPVLGRKITSRQLLILRRAVFFPLLLQVTRGVPCHTFVPLREIACNHGTRHIVRAARTIGPVPRPPRSRQSLNTLFRSKTQTK